MNAGDLDKRITIQAPTKVPDGMGGFTETYSDIGSVWASLEPVTKWDSERLEAMRLESQVTHKCGMRFRRDILPSWRLKKGTRYFDITTILNPKEANADLVIYCKETI